MSQDRIDVSVLVPVLNEEAHLRDAAEGMLSQEFDGTIEFLFIDGGSSDASPSILLKLADRDQRVRVLQNPDRRTPHALNIGLRQSHGEFIARMDAHTVYPPRYLAIGVARLQRGDVESVSGAQIAVGVSPGSRRVALALSTSLGTGGAGFRREREREREVDTGFTGIWRRSTLERHGGWDEQFVNDQDMELAARIRSDGGRIVCVPGMEASYIPRDTLSTLARQYLRYGSYRVKTTLRHPHTLRRSQVLPPALTLTAAASLLAPTRSLRRAARAGMSGYSATLLRASVIAAREGAGFDAAALPAMWATMHFSYGIGFLIGCGRFGMPLAGLRHLLDRAQRSAEPRTRSDG